MLSVRSSKEYVCLDSTLILQLDLVAMDKD